MTNITEQRKVFFLRWPFFAHAAQEELYRLIFTSKEREAHQLPARYPGPRKPCSKASFALPVSLAEEKQALNAFDIPSSFVRPIRSDAPHNVEMMAISEVASSAHSENDMDGDDFPQWTFKIDDDSWLDGLLSTCSLYSCLRRKQSFCPLLFSGHSGGATSSQYWYQSCLRCAWCD